MMIKPFVDQSRSFILPNGTKPDFNVKQRTRNIYINSIPNVIMDDDYWMGLKSLHNTITIVNRSFIEGDILLEETRGADWVFLKSIYIFSASSNFNDDPIETFPNLTMYPQSEMTTGFYQKNGEIRSLGISFVDLDQMSGKFLNIEAVSVNSEGIEDGNSRLKSVDPRFFSDREHYETLEMFPEDFLPEISYKGHQLVDHQTQIWCLQGSKPKPFLEGETGEAEKTTDIVPTDTLCIRSFWLNDVLQEMMHYPSFGLFDEFYMIYDSDFGIDFTDMKIPKLFPDLFSKLLIAEFSEHATAIFSKLVGRAGPIRVNYHRTDYIDRIQVIFKNQPTPTNSMSMRSFRTNLIDNVLLGERPVR